MSSEDEPCEECEEGAPEWLATFADLMSLLMCFFVLLLSFSEMDIQKYKQVAGSMQNAFGIQKKIEVDKIPEGTSVIAREYTPGRPEPTQFDVIEQQTDSVKDTPKTGQPVSAQVSELVEALEAELQGEIDAEVLELIAYPDGVMIRVREQDAFPSGSAQLQRGFRPILNKLIETFNHTPGQVIVAGHTDNLPINTQQYPSNWVLSSARAASVVHYLAKNGLEDPSRVEIRAYADTQPVVENTTADNRARNRRVEINVRFDE